jgi:hypothetical protein
VRASASVRNRMQIVTIVAYMMIAALGAPTSAGAQAASSFRDLQSVLHGGERLTITDNTGIVTNGRFIALSDQSLRVTVKSTVPMDLSEGSVAKIERLASNSKKGAVVGLIAGAVVGALAVALTPCERFCGGPGKGTVILPVAGIAGGIGAGVGAGIGALRSTNRLIYLAPRPTSSPAGRP